MEIDYLYEKWITTNSTTKRDDRCSDICYSVHGGY